MRRARFGANTVNSFAVRSAAVTAPTKPSRAIAPELWCKNTE
jgi:hypothetical protein